MDWQHRARSEVVRYALIAFHAARTFMGIVIYPRCSAVSLRQPIRAGGQSQFSALLDLEPKTDRIQKALTYARLNLQKDLSVEALADIAGLSPRQFSRAFHEETSQSPAKAIEHLRVEAARLMLEEGRLPIEVIANEVGFGDRERMRRSFIRNIGHPPTSVRRNASQKRATGTRAHAAP
jgi:transcriptional regulator GlxA family with amidase domain